jgi:transcriptional regulator GlxA family with amidase domain
MALANVEVSLNEDEIKKHVYDRLDDMVRESLIMIDVETLAKKMCLSKRFLEDEFLSDIRMKAIERRKSRKRLYFYDEVIPVIKEIVYEKF